MLDGVREAASFEGLIALAVFYWIISMVSKAGKKGTGVAPPVPPRDAGTTTATQEEGFSLEAVLREIERVKRDAETRSAPPVPKQVPPPKQSAWAKAKAARKAAPPLRSDRLKDVQDERGPLGRQSSVRLPSAESDEASRFPEAVDLDQEAEEVVQRRLREVEARNRPLTDEDHQRFDTEIRRAGQEQAGRSRFTAQQLRDAFVWREILGPPKALE